jgi:hypothetical protein
MIPVSERAKTFHIIDRAVTVIGLNGIHGVISQEIEELFL